jgi:hypothetical protein
MIIRIYNEVKSALEEKYPDAYMVKGEYNGYEDMHFYTAQGWIDLYVTKSDGYYVNPYTLHIDYYDNVNDKKNEKSKKIDL